MVCLHLIYGVALHGALKFCEKSEKFGDFAGFFKFLGVCAKFQYSAYVNAILANGAAAFKPILWIKQRETNRSL
ncbi:hypothetical protein TREAZ_0427 [Leadbettera azotonutricia ZAS-9]|uniref:Uncharacterized protein n=1 Tax=Leadbettera azotonutricia (strain ATCC BAA-888 / DSM 13862 / ZAS-9) TaxID=545695 RepID=F5YCU7_LEAAZ|nr:hypothetical protein TREAZ_0427 [Leadbettera azotonutricia ZAS-9]